MTKAEGVGGEILLPPLLYGFVGNQGGGFLDRSQILHSALGLSQEEFAVHYRIPIGALRDWEQGRSEPDAPGRAYLWIIAKEPELVRRTLAQNGAAKGAAAV